jgi:chorismate--pyruvate lyase
MHALFTDLWQRNPPATATWQAPWLLASGSLTQRLMQVCRNEFHVKVLRHEFVPAPELACDELMLQANEQVLQREVLLCDGDEPLVFACSLLPEAMLHGRYQDLRTLGTRPLGHWIFSEPILTRQAMLFADLALDDELFKELPPQNTASLLGRKTLFVGAYKPLLVSEFFLPALEQRSKASRL